jgi:TPR repeat protein
LGWMYQEGRGVPRKDPEEAYMWYDLSLLNGDTDAQARLDALEGQGWFNSPKLSQEAIERARDRARRRRAEQGEK